MTAIDTNTETPELGERITLDLQLELQTLSVAERRMGLRLLSYNKIVTHPHYGAIMFQPGAFGEVDPASIRLRMDHEDPPTGLGASFNDQPDAPYMEFVLSKTARAEEQLTLAKDGVSRGASVGFNDIVGKPKIKRIEGRNVTVYGPGSAQLAEVSTTWQPTFESAGVMYVLSKDEKGKGPQMAEDQEAPVAGAVDTAPIVAAIQQGFSDGKSAVKLEQAAEKMLGMVDRFEEFQRSQFNVPKSEERKPKLHDWVEITLRRLRGEAISPTRLKELALDDVITGEQPGLVPDLLVPDYDDLISSSRPFLSSTREITPPATGTSMLLPIITTRAVAGTQYGGEKGELTTVATKVGTGTFAYVAVFGGADISIQMIQRAGSSFFDLLTGDMGEAYALDCEAKAIDALLTGYTDSGGNSHTVTTGGVLDPEIPNFGEAWKNSILASKRAPTHIWMSATAVGAFIDALSPTTNAPLYSNLAASFTAGGGPGGTLSGLTPVYVPALDSASVDVIVGPSRGFVWAEDPALNLQADVPSNAGRDIALVGGIFPAPRNADAFTTYTVTS